MSFALTVLGSSAMYATRDRACSGYLLDLDGTNIWLDAGAGTWRNLLNYIDYSAIDGVILTHRHPDHTTDVFQAFHARRYGKAEAMERIPLWAPQETVDGVKAYSGSVDEAFDFHTVAAGDIVSIGGADISFVGMEHPCETLGVRVEMDGAILAYSSDAGGTSDFDALARGCDIFLCEATFQDSDSAWSGHISATDAGTIAARVGAKRLVLTHLPPGRDLGLSLAQAHRASDGVPVELAADGLRIELR